MSPNGANSNPYAEQTEANTRTDWLSEQEPLDVEIDGMTDFAGNMKTIAENLRNHKSYVDQAGTLPNQAWGQPVLPEIAYMKSRFLGNYAELAQYFANLETALMNIGSAAQTVADSYQGTDGWSAASLNAVKWAFGDRNASRPDGLPAGFDYKTYHDVYFEQLLNGDGQQSGSYPVWESQDPVTENGVTTYTATNQHGETRTITEEYVPGVGYVTTTTVTSRDGEVLSQHRQTTESRLVGGGVSTTTTTTTDGETTSRSNSFTEYGADGSHTETTRQYDGDNNVTGIETHEVRPDGSQVITDRDPDGDEQELHIGADTEGVTELPESPVQEARQRLAE